MAVNARIKQDVQLLKKTNHSPFKQVTGLNDLSFLSTTRHYSESFSNRHEDAVIKINVFEIICLFINVKINVF